MALKKENPVDIADQLEVVRRSIADQRKIERELTAKLLTLFHKNHIKRAGNYHLITADTFKIADEELALQFALQRGLTKIDTAKARKVFQLDSTIRFDDPLKYGFEIVTQEKIAPIKGSLEE